MRIRRPRREWTETYAAEANQIREAARLARAAPEGWRVMLTDGCEVRDLFGDRNDWRECLADFYRRLNLPATEQETVVQLCRRIRKVKP